MFKDFLALVIGLKISYAKKVYVILKGKVLFLFPPVADLKVIT